MVRIALFLMCAGIWAFVGLPFWVRRLPHIGAGKNLCSVAYCLAQACQNDGKEFSESASSIGFMRDARKARLHLMLLARSAFWAIFGAVE